jgi:hypothetical protein
MLATLLASEIPAAERDDKVVLIEGVGSSPDTVTMHIDTAKYRTLPPGSDVLMTLAPAEDQRALVMVIGVCQACSGTGETQCGIGRRFLGPVCKPGTFAAKFGGVPNRANPARLGLGAECEMVYTPSGPPKKVGSASD